ncbi:Serine/threonine-protein kinase pkn1 [compost metagenome]
MVFVEGGEFLMGDYGVQHGPERLPYDSDKDSKPLHKVELSNFSIDRFKITNKDFQFYLSYNGLTLRTVDEGNQENWSDISTAPDTPAHLDWYEADRYCSWLAKISDLPFSLPTEAQWEYAARSRGQFLMVATDDGTYKTDRRPSTSNDGPRGINISTYQDRADFAKQMGWKTRGLTPLPVDRFPPNPLGLYDMSDNGLEWVKDWYDPDYYQYSPIKDPQGPAEPVFKGPASNNKYAKVLRGVAYANPQWGGGVNVHRSYRNPDGYLPSPGAKRDLLFISNKTARCVVNSTIRVN